MNIVDLLNKPEMSVSLVFYFYSIDGNDGAVMSSLSCAVLGLLTLASLIIAIN